MGTPATEIAHWDTWNSKYRQPETLDEPSRRRMHEILASLRGLKVQGAKVLEVGCGTGWLSSKLREFGEVTAVDLGVEIIEAAKVLYPEIDFRSGDIHTLDLAVGSFDVIVTLETFSHVPDQSAFLRRLSELLKPSGLLLLTTQNRFVFERRSDVRPNIGYLRKWVTMSELKRLLRSEFSLRRATSLEPEGHLGLLRVVNSVRLNGLLSRVLKAAWLKRAKEQFRFGQTLYVVAVKR